MMSALFSVLRSRQDAASRTPSIRMKGKSRVGRSQCTDGEKVKNPKGLGRWVSEDLHRDYDESSVRSMWYSTCEVQYRGLVY